MNARCRSTAVVIRFYNDKKKALDDIVLVTTDPDLKAKEIVTPDEQRPEIEPDYEQLKSGGWQLQKRRSTRDRQIVFYLLTGLLSYRLAQLLATTAAGSNFAGKTRCAIECEQLKSRWTNVIVYAGGYFEGCETFPCAHPLSRRSNSPAALAGSVPAASRKARVTFPQRSYQKRLSMLTLKNLFQPAQRSTVRAA